MIALCAVLLVGITQSLPLKKDQLALEEKNDLLQALKIVLARRMNAFAQGRYVASDKDVAAVERMLKEMEKKQADTQFFGRVFHG